MAAPTALLGLLGTFGKWLISEVVLKVVVMAVLFLLMHSLMPYVWNLVFSMVSPDLLKDSFNGIPATVWWFLGMVDVQYGVAMMVSAYMTRFIIRRMPVVG